MKNLFLLLLLILPLTAIHSQETNYPLRDIFEAGTLIDNQTVNTPYKGLMEFQIHHRFGLVTNGIEDVFGVYAPSNIRLGLNFGITDKIMLGGGYTKDYKLFDLHGKYAFLYQTSTNSFPVSITYYGNIVADLRDEAEFGPEESFREIHRLSYFNQIIVARKFNDVFSMQVAPTFFYYNSVMTGYKNVNFGLSAGGRVMFAPSHSILLEYDQNFTKQDDESFNPKPQLAIGWEKSTATHAFQVFFANYKGIIGQRNMLYNQNDLAKGEYLIGFNITVKF